VPKTLLTDIAVRNLTPPPSGQATHCDTSPGFNGFGLRISQGGAKTWILMAGPPEKRRRYVLGRYPATSLSDARSAARKLHAELTLGQRTTSSIAFSEAVESYLKTYCLKMRPRHRDETERILRKHFLPRLGSRHLDQITTAISPAFSIHSRPQPHTWRTTPMRASRRFCVGASAAVTFPRALVTRCNAQRLSFVDRRPILTHQKHVPVRHNLEGGQLFDADPGQHFGAV
jgi:hypothetical protein